MDQCILTLIQRKKEHLLTKGQVSIIQKHSSENFINFFFCKCLNKHYIPQIMHSNREA
jgi:hypothetical protein